MYVCADYIRIVRLGHERSQENFLLKKSPYAVTKVL